MRPLLAQAPASTRAQIDDAGVVYRYNTAGLGVVRFVAMTDVPKGGSPGAAR
jgi:hypothetical protein